jgi:DNA polymerase elongation subunit (family B)
MSGVGETYGCGQKKLRTLVFDIETIGEDFDVLDETTQDVLTRWIRKEHAGNEAGYAVALADLKDGLGFSPLTGQIVAIGVLDAEHEKTVVYYQHPQSEGQVIEEGNVIYKSLSERAMLEQFWRGCAHYDQFVSFNGRGFDVPYLMIRSAVHGIRPSRDLLSNRYMNLQHDGKHIDLADQLSFYGATRTRGTLHAYCRAFGVKSPKADGVCGDDVGALFKAGKYLAIARYNVGDLVATKELYDRWERYVRF